ncbi:MAG: NADH-ubiquinone oxidoreductase-F iron-sulfur binding region domain-containing protein [Mobilitalea sp.]
MNSLIDKGKQLTKQDVIDKVAALEIREYGVYHDYLIDIWNNLLDRHDSEKLPIQLVTALNNNDTKKVLLDIVRKTPHKVLEGMQIVAYVLGAKDLFLYLPENEKQLLMELELIAKDYGIQIVSSGFVDRRKYEVCAFHHIETMAVLAEAFTDHYETGVLAAVARNGIVSDLQKIPYGTKVSDMISTKAEDMKGFEINSKIYNSSALDMIIDKEFAMGNGVITIINNTDCMINEAKKHLETAHIIGCGKCTFCREGILQLYGLVKDITKSKGKNEFLTLMKEIGEALPSASLCSIGKTGADFLLDSLTLYSSEYEDHIKRKKCAATVCDSFVPIYIDPELCIGCEECTSVCPEDCIEGKTGYIHMIDELDCTKCGKCIEVCESGAIKKASGRTPKLPERLTKCGKFRKH